jgi:hypothetical protein
LAATREAVAAEIVMAAVRLEAGFSRRQTTCDSQLLLPTAAAATPLAALDMSIDAAAVTYDIVAAAAAVLDTAQALVEAAGAAAVAAAAIAALVFRGKLHSSAFVPQSHEMDQMAKPLEAQAS